MKIKMICCDMDGTLLNSNKKISDESKKALFRAMEDGVIVVLATGRTAPGLREFYTELGLDVKGNHYVCGINGAEIYSFKNKTYEFDNEMPVEDAKYILNNTNCFAATRYIFTPHTFYSYESKFTRIVRRISCKIKGVSPNYGLEGEMLNMKEIKDLDNDVVLRPVTKTIVVQPAWAMKLSMSKYRKAMEGKFEVLMVNNRWLEFMPMGVNKGNGIKCIAEMNNITPEEVLCFGDGENDISMLEYAKYGFAMENALENVKAKAYGVCDSNDNNGIAKTINRLMYKE